MSRIKRWNDAEIMRWANHYIVLGTPIMKLENKINVPHSTIWWCFTHRLQHIDPTMHAEVLERLNSNKMKMKGRGIYAGISD